MKFKELLPSPFYRVAVKAIILSDDNKMLLVRSDEGWEIPGGGWEHDEEFHDCIVREIDEELGVGVESAEDILFVYRGKNVKNYIAMRLAIRVVVSSQDFKPKDPDILECKYFSKDELLQLGMTPDEEAIKSYVDKIWE